MRYLLTLLMAIMIVGPAYGQNGNQIVTLGVKDTIRFGIDTLRLTVEVANRIPVSGGSFQLWIKADSVANMFKQAKLSYGYGRGFKPRVSNGLPSDSILTNVLGDTIITVEDSLTIWGVVTDTTISPALTERLYLEAWIADTTLVGGTIGAKDTTIVEMGITYQ